MNTSESEKKKQISFQGLGDHSNILKAKEKGLLAFDV